MQNSQIINILGENYKIIDTKERITIADSFVVKSNKIGGGNGEAKLYIGQEGEETRDFFGDTGFRNKCFLLKKDLQKYLEDTRLEYLKPEQPYLNKELLPKLWSDRSSLVKSLPERIEFDIDEQTQIDGPRIYVKSYSQNYRLIRELSLPNITYISVIKLFSNNTGVEYYFRLFADYFGEEHHPSEIINLQTEIENQNVDKNTAELLVKARIGQGEYRKNLLAQCPFCPITNVSDDRILIASHIKPWKDSNSFEKTDPNNGFMFTPTFDRLFDRGFMTFTNEKKVLLSPFLSNMTYKNIGISQNRIITNLPINEARINYLEFHRVNIFKGPI